MCLVAFDPSLGGHGHLPGSPQVSPTLSSPQCHLSFSDPSISSSAQAETTCFVFAYGFGASQPGFLCQQGQPASPCSALFPVCYRQCPAQPQSVLLMLPGTRFPKKSNTVGSKDPKTQEKMHLCLPQRQVPQELWW